MYLINSKISGMSRSLCFILSFMAVMMELALSSAPCLEDFSAAPAKHTAQAVPGLFSEQWDAPGRPPRPAFRPATATLGFQPDQTPTQIKSTAMTSDVSSDQVVDLERRQPGPT